MSPWSPTAPGKMGRKFGFCCMGPVLPTAQQSSAARHCTDESCANGWPVSAPATRLHADPFHCSITAPRFSPLSSLENPTATQLDADVQLTPCRFAPTTPGPVGVGLGTIDHEVPFQFSISVPVGFPSPAATPRTAPTAQQSDPLTQDTAKNPPKWPGGSGGCAPRVH